MGIYNDTYFNDFYLKGLTMHSIFEVKHSIAEPRIWLSTTQTPRIGDDKLKQGNTDASTYKQSENRELREI